jgi:hypothetical protein
MPLTKAQREQRAVNEAYSRQTQKLAPKPEFVSRCPSHPSWRVEITGGRIAPPHAGLCPECAAEELARRNPAKQPTRKHDPGSAGREADFAYHLWREKHPSDQLEPGSIEESEALQAIAEARYAEEEHSDPPSQGILVSARVEDGRYTEFWKPRGSRQIVKVLR